MGIVNYSEYSGMAKDGIGGMPPIVAQPAISSKNLTSSGSEADSDAFDAETTIVRIKTDTNIYLLFGASPQAASAGDVMMSAGDTEYFKVTAGHIFSVIDK